MVAPVLEEEREVFSIGFLPPLWTVLGGLLGVTLVTQVHLSHKPIPFRILCFGSKIGSTNRLSHFFLLLEQFI